MISGAPVCTDSLTDYRRNQNFHKYCHVISEVCLQAGEADVQDTAQAGARGIDRDFLTLMPLE